MSLVDFSAFVDELATASGEAILPFFRTALGIEDKAGKTSFDPVTAADRAGEVIMRNMIKRYFPTHGIIGEEYGDEKPDAEFVWVLDPIDGTKSFISGFPTWGTLIGLMRARRPVFGMMHQPFTGERFAGDGQQASWRGHGKVRKLMTRPCADLGHATLATTHPNLMDQARLARFRAVEDRVRLSRYGGDCYAYCALAAGHIDVVAESGLAPHDIVALVPIIEGAGGIVTTWEGGDPARGGDILAAGDRRTHAQALELLRTPAG
jgi:myo-inositol-1(or 4)-monophosphatase